jgi:hypothetical protein
VPTVITSPGDPTANSYVSVAEADFYHTTRLHVELWTGSTVTTAIKEAAVIMATRTLDLLYEWYSRPTYLTQALQWPRIGMLDFLQLSILGEGVIPSQLKNATAEFARQLIGEDRTEDSEIEAQKIRSLDAGPISISFGEGVVPKVVPDAVFSMIPKHWGFVSGRVEGTVPLMRT